MSFEQDGRPPVAVFVNAHNARRYERICPTDAFHYLTLRTRPPSILNY